MANWTTISKTNSTQPQVIGSVNSFWQVEDVSYQGDINTKLEGIDSLFTFYGENSVTGLTSLTNENTSIFFGFPSSAQLVDSFEIYNGTSGPLTHVGTMQQLVGRDPGNPNNTVITIYAPHIDTQPVGHIGLIEAFSVEFDNPAIGDPSSTEAQDAILSLTSRMYNYSSFSGPTFNGTWANDITDQATGLFAKGGVMTIADDSTGNNPVVVKPV